jgi:hypothetical protein
MMPVEPITVAVIVGLVIAIALGAAVAGLVCMKRQRFSLRLPEDLHRRLKEAAGDHMWDLKAEIISRLQASFRSRSYDF